MASTRLVRISTPPGGRISVSSPTAPDRGKIRQLATSVALSVCLLIGWNIAGTAVHDNPLVVVARAGPWSTKATSDHRVATRRKISPGRQPGYILPVG